ncbi:MAG TPA: HU family DNA-binding protein [Candidatus Acidoferrales bacterium]|nr:HU family DNA-binding protein [Candidatus Acidoferrales bacterium]
MKKAEIVRRLARQSGLSDAEAADRLDRMVHEIVSGVRRGRTQSLPGLGRFRAGSGGRLRFERAEAKRHG